MSVFFLRTTQKNHTCSALLCGVDNTCSATLLRYLNSFISVPGSYKLDRYHHRTSSPSSSTLSPTFASCHTSNICICLVIHESLVYRVNIESTSSQHRVNIESTSIPTNNDEKLSKKKSTFSQLMLF